MRLGPKEKAILRALDFDGRREGGWTPPSGYAQSLAEVGMCPSTNRSVQRLREKGLVEFRYETMSPAEALEAHRLYPPGWQAREHNGALRLTVAGCQKRFEIGPGPAPAPCPMPVSDLSEDIPF